MSRVATINAWPDDVACAAFLHCLGADKWARQMTAGRPYAQGDAMLAAAEKHWDGLERSDWLEAFARHPKIGDLESLRTKFKDTAHLAGSEQGQVRLASEAMLQKLARLNQVYLERFGFIFIVCATGKSADEMLSLLEARLDNRPDRELRIAAEEQKKIAILRMEKLGA